MKLAPALLLLLSIYQIFCDSSFTCNTPTSGALTQETILTQGDNTILCVHFIPFKVKIGFQVEVDKFAVLSIRYIFNVMAAKDTDLAIQLANSENISNQIPYVRTTANQVFPVINLLITLDMGKISSIALEDFSSACAEAVIPEIINQGNSFASENTIKNCPVAFCQGAESDTGKCDFKIFLSWIGTDKDGNGLISSSERLSNFKNYNLEGIFNSILEIDSNTVAGTVDPYSYSSISPDVQERLK